MCLSPIPCSWAYSENYFISSNGVIDKSKIFDFQKNVYVSNKIIFNDFAHSPDFFVKCGECVECMQAYSNEWALRCQLEASNYSENCFLTLTYESCKASLVKKHLQDFVKRLRERIAPKKLRYFACGEYGAIGKRPHYHLIIFGYCPNDLELFDRKNLLYRSKFIERIWHGGKWENGYKPGFVTVGNSVNFDTAKYCAKYLQKLVDCPKDCLVPFTLMSRKPGIAFQNFNRKDFENGGIFVKGVKRQIPRYFEKKYKELYAVEDDLYFVQKKRICELSKRSNNDIKALKIAYKKLFGKFCKKS